ncbi:hypothetical protein EK21DRAFT_119588 [Setomelanomma holmii]|uniref:Uncharacterized protein n=1 Tax=Setomelanomma holmii TaxID=210430 RepID=A0A9P4GVQ5_9PLEO|nr:hypothetical protein EK21DRAFT_119588 [Setomelanomma holmii]
MVLSKTRAFIIPLEASECIDLYDPWLLHRFDHEDMAFLGPSNSRRDFGTISLAVSVPDGIGRQTTTNCHFYAFGWYSGRLDLAHFSLVEASMYTPQYTAIQPWVEGWDRSSMEFMQKLNDQGVPKQSGVLIRLGKTGNTFLVTFTVERLSSKDVCTHVYWKVIFSCAVYPTSECPKIQQGQWQMGTVHLGRTT